MPPDQLMEAQDLKKTIREQAHANRKAQAEQGRAEPGDLREVRRAAGIRRGRDA